MNRDNLRMFEVANWILLTIAIVTGSLLLSVISLVSLIIELVQESR